MKKLLNIFIIMIMVLSIFNINESRASINVNDYKPSDLEETQVAINMGNKIIGAFQAIGSIVSVMALVVIGIKYMISSVEEKAEYKQTMIYYITGAILVFSISNISAILYKFASKFWLKKGVILWKMLF